MEQIDSHPLQPQNSLRKTEILLIAVVLVFAHHAITYWLFYSFLPSRVIYDRFGPLVYQNTYDALSVIMPLLLCLGAATRSGLCLGTWRPRIWKILAVCTLPPTLVAIIYPFTSQPFTNDRIGCWLISPAAQDLLFSGYLYGLLNTTFPGRLCKRVPIDKAVFMTAVLFSLWHTPNFTWIGPAFVCFQLLYTFLFCGWILIARQWTGSIIPVVLSHMASNFVSWQGW